MVRYALLSMFALLAAVTASSTAYAADSTSADVQAISKIEREWANALKTRNKTFFEKHLSDDFTYIGPNGDVSSGRAAFIELVMKMPPIVEFADSDDKVAVHGATGVATGRVAVKYGNGTSEITRYTDVYAKGSDGWKSVASHESNSK